MCHLEALRSAFDRQEVEANIGRYNLPSSLTDLLLTAVNPHRLYEHGPERSSEREIEIFNRPSLCVVAQLVQRYTHLRVHAHMVLNTRLHPPPPPPPPPQVEHETPAPKPAELTAVENLQLTRPNLQQLMFEDVCAFRPECRAMAPGGGGGDPSPASTEFSDISINSPAVGGPGGAAAVAAVAGPATAAAEGGKLSASAEGLASVGEGKGRAAAVGAGAAGASAPAAAAAVAT